MDIEDKNQLDSILRILYNEGEQAWYRVYTKLGLNKAKAELLFRIGKAFGYITTIHKGRSEFPTDNHYVGLTDAGISFFALSNFSDEPKAVSPFHTVINYSGDNGIVNTGSGSHINASIIQTKGNKEILRKELLKAQIAEEDVNELIEVVGEEHTISQNEFGPKVKKWMGKMVNKAIDGSWQVGISAAGGILANILQHYYGI